MSNPRGTVLTVVNDDDDFNTTVVQTTGLAVVGFIFRKVGGLAALTAGVKMFGSTERVETDATAWFPIANSSGLVWLFDGSADCIVWLCSETGVTPEFMAEFGLLKFQYVNAAGEGVAQSGAPTITPIFMEV